MLTSAQVGAALRDLAEFTWVSLDSREDAIQVARAAAIPVEITVSPAVGWRVAERREPARPTSPAPSCSRVRTFADLVTPGRAGTSLLLLGGDRGSAAPR